MASVWPSISSELGSVFSSAASSASSSWPLGAQLRAAALVEGSVLAFDQLNAQPLGGDGDLDLLGELLQILARLDLLFELFFQLLQLLQIRCRWPWRAVAGSGHGGAEQAGRFPWGR